MSSQAGQKKYPPSEDKLRKLRRDGQWYSSAELSSAAALAVFALILTVGLSLFSSRLVGMARLVWSPDVIASGDPLHALAASAQRALATLSLLVAVVLLTTMFSAAVSKFLQVGPLFSVKPLWRLAGLNPFTRFKSIFFSSQTYKHAALSLLKAALMAALVAFNCWRAAPALILSSRIGVLATVQVFVGRFTRFFWEATFLYALFAGADYFIRRSEFLKEQWMTDEEMKEEQRRTHGSPEAKARIRGEQRRRLRQALARVVRSTTPPRMS